jgi:hypothetical protein
MNTPSSQTEATAYNSNRAAMIKSTHMGTKPPRPYFASNEYAEEVVFKALQVNMLDELYFNCVLLRLEQGCCRVFVVEIFMAPLSYVKFGHDILSFTISMKNLF